MQQSDVLSFFDFICPISSPNHLFAIFFEIDLFDIIFECLVYVFNELLIRFSSTNRKWFAIKSGWGKHNNPAKSPLLLNNNWHKLGQSTIHQSGYFAINQRLCKTLILSSFMIFNSDSSKIRMSFKLIVTLKNPSEHQRILSFMSAVFAMFDDFFSNQYLFIFI